MRVIMIHGTIGVAPNNKDMRQAFDMISGDWKLEILWLLHQRLHRFDEIKRNLPGITQHMLTSQLRELQADGLISRQVLPDIPPRVEYALLPAAVGLVPAIEGLRRWCGQMVMQGKQLPESAEKAA